jgi:S-adenosylmethionine-dependent methyltransferase
LDISFDQLGPRLEKRVYGGPKGSIRLAVLKRDLQDLRVEIRGRAVADLGCGGGRMSRWAGEEAAELWINDASSLQLTQARENLQTYQGKLVTSQGPMQSADFPKAYFTLLMCHGVLGWTDKPWENLEYSLSLLRPGAYLSLLVFNPHRWMLKKARLGHWEAVESGKPAYIKGRNLSPPNPLEPRELESFLKDRGRILRQSGVRIFWEGSPEQSYDSHVLKLELEHSAQEPFCRFGYHTHYLFQKK